ncbi:hypothetical protein M514_14378 [Trichuris suis]|uniref:Uncharacterized protein n=1 Tax=Trichuris suis TaxID=68888 RepID=A0A085N2H4_9BILA|nr:hypothetical protein M514_14378 [Trichuris suis]
MEKYDSTGSRHFAQIETTRKKRVVACLDLVLRQEERRLLDRIITRDEYWCPYVNGKSRGLTHDKHTPPGSLP